MRRHFKVLVIVGCGCSVALLLTAYVLRRSRTGKKPLSKSLDTKQDDSELSVIESDSGIAKDEDPASATSGSSSYTSCEEELPETPETDSSNNSDSSAPINILPQGGGGGHTRDFRQKTIPDRREFDTPNNSGSRVLDIRHHLEPKAQGALSGQTESGKPVGGAVGESTYERHLVTPLSATEFQDLLQSPVIQSIDVRMNRSGSTQGKSTTDDCDIVQRYDSELSPSIVDEQCVSISGIYSDIVAPLCPNTGTIIPDANVTTRKRRSRLHQDDE